LDNSSASFDTLTIFLIVRLDPSYFITEKISELHTALEQLESWFPKIIAHQRNPNIQTTNNLLEEFQKKYLYYPAFKKSLMTSDGAQRVLDYRVFRHNFCKFPGYIVEMRVRYETYRLLVKETKNHPTLRGAGMYFKHKFRKLDIWFGNYMEI
jgi:hypothetical protein